MSYSQGPYYAGGGGNGGGGGFLSPFATQSSPGDGQKKANQHSLRPLTILALHNATQAHGEAAFTVDGQEIGQVTMVAKLCRDGEKKTTNFIFELDDGTARIDARHWIEAGETDEDFADFKEGEYVRVMGNLKMIGSQKHFGAPTIRLASAKEFLFHLADVMLVWAELTIGAPSGSGGAAPYAATSNGDASVYAAGGGQVQQVQDNPNYAHLPALERSILTCMQSAPPDEDGIDVPFIVGRLSTQGTRAGASEISAALDRLMDEGHIYTTFDDSHFLVA